MSRNERHENSDPEVSLDEVVDLGSVPPPSGAGFSDVHVARTAVAPLPPALIQQMLAGKREPDPCEGSSAFTSEAPTVPGKDSARLRRPVAPRPSDVPPASFADDLVGAVTAALETASQEQPVAKAPPPRRPEPPPLPEPPPISSPLPAAPLPPPSAFHHEAMPSGPPVTMEEPMQRRMRLEILIALIVVAAAGIVIGAMTERLLHPH